MKSRRIKAVFTVAIISTGAQAFAWSQSNVGPQLMKDIAEMDVLSNDFNSKSKDPKRAEALINSYEKLLDRSFSADEKKFFMQEFANAPAFPHVEIKGNSIQFFDDNKNTKEAAFNIDIVDVEKSIFKFGNHTFQVDRSKGLLENVQFVLKELRKGEVK
jgi:hypothetical protein